MASRSPARWLAPIALLAALAAVGLVYQSTTEDKSSPSKSSTNDRDGKSGSSKTGTGTTAKTTAGEGPKTYRVKTGDTLGGIAVATGVSITELQELNPDLDAQGLQPGQRIRLRR